MTLKRLEEILRGLSSVRIAVAGDFFLDKYLDIDRSLREVSVETGLEAHQVVSVRCYPGAAGTVTNNLAALGVAEVWAVGAIGDDGEGYELCRGLEKTGVRLDLLIRAPDLRTPTYTKPMLKEPGREPREIERLDIKNRQSLPARIEKAFIERLGEAVRQFDGVIIADQVPEQNHGLITDKVRQRLGHLGQAFPGKIILADSRERIGLFQNVIVKPNRTEAFAAILKKGPECPDDDAVARVGRRLFLQTNRPAFITAGAEGIYVVAPDGCQKVPAYKPQGPIDIVGAGDSVAAAICAALCAGASLEEAALVGCLTASITIEQIGVTGTASRAALRRRLREYTRQQQAGPPPSGGLGS